MDLIGIGALAMACVLLLAIPHWQRKRRRREMGLEPLSYRENWNWPR